MGFPNIEKPKRSLGQNFFTNANLGKSIVEKVLENSPKQVIEIGPGRGFFTKLFLEKNVKVIAIEKDDVLKRNLDFLFPNIKIFNEDIFSKKIESIFQKTEDTVCFGSLPYNISKRIISYLGKISDIEAFYFIIQKEVAEKYTSRKKHSFLSISTEIYFDSNIIFNIAPENFKPKPNVTSSFIKFVRNKNAYRIEKIEDFLKYLHIAFKQPRKTLKNNLGKHYEIANVEEKTLKFRAEDLNIQEHLNIWERLK